MIPCLALFDLFLFYVNSWLFLPPSEDHCVTTIPCLAIFKSSQGLPSNDDSMRGYFYVRLGFTCNGHSIVLSFQGRTRTRVRGRENPRTLWTRCTIDDRYLPSSRRRTADAQRLRGSQVAAAWQTRRICVVDAGRLRGNHVAGLLPRHKLSFMSWQLRAKKGNRCVFTRLMVNLVTTAC